MLEVDFFALGNPPKTSHYFVLVGAQARGTRRFCVDHVSSHGARVDISVCGPSWADFGFVRVCATFHSEVAQTIGRAAYCRLGWRQPNPHHLLHASSENHNRCKGKKGYMATIWFVQHCFMFSIWRVWRLFIPVKCRGFG